MTAVIHSANVAGQFVARHWLSSST